MYTSLWILNREMEDGWHPYTLCEELLTYFLIKNRII